MTEERIDRRAARTRRALSAALIGLILRKGYDAVSVGDIVEAADVGRSTFYAHYRSKEALLRGGFRVLRDELAEAQRAGRASGGGSGGTLGFSRALFEHAAGYAEVYRALAGGRGGVVALSEIRAVLAEIVGRELGDGDAEVPQRLRVEFVVGTFLTVLTWWLERTPDLPPARVDAVFRRLASGGIGA